MGNPLQPRNKENFLTKSQKWKAHIQNKANPHEVTGDQMAVDGKLGPCLPRVSDITTSGRRRPPNTHGCPHLIWWQTAIENGDIWLRPAEDGTGDEVYVQSDGITWRLSESGWVQGGPT